MVDNRCDPRALGIDRAQRGRPARQATRGICRPVDRIHDHAHAPLGFVASGLLGHHTEAGVEQHRHNGIVRSEIQYVLARPGTPFATLRPRRLHPTTNLCREFVEE